MLKIKDNVDLKELENFGLKETKNTYLKKHTMGEAISIHKDTKIIYMTEDDGISYYYHIGILYDLIQAGLVEKVSD